MRFGERTSPDAKKIFFVRHGESEGNVLRVHQDGSYPLTDKGKEQAAFIGKRIAGLPIELLLSSSMVRTRQTTEAIVKATGLTPEFSDLFVETRAASELVGKSIYDPEAQRVTALRQAHLTDPDWHYSDEENYTDLIKRGHAALAFLHSKEEKSICVVTHGEFMKVMVAAAIFGQTLTPEELRFVRKSFHMENTGLSVLVHDPAMKDPWFVWIWNDHAHLAE